MNGKRPATFHEFAKLDAGTAAQMHQRSMYALAFWAACRLPEKPIHEQTDFPVVGFAVDIPSLP